MPGTVVLSERIEKLLNALALSPTELAAALGTQKYAVLGWLANNEYPSPEVDAGLEALLRLVRRLNSTFDSPETVRAWLRSRSAYLEGRQPKDVLRTGDIEAVNGALNALDAGIFV